MQYAIEHLQKSSTKQLNQYMR